MLRSTDHKLSDALCVCFGGRCEVEISNEVAAINEQEELRMQHMRLPKVYFLIKGDWCVWIMFEVRWCRD